MYVMNFNLDDKIVLGTLSLLKITEPEALFYASESVLSLK